MLGAKQVNRFKNIEIIQIIFSDHNRMKLQTIRKINLEIRKSFEMNKNEKSLRKQKTMQK